MNEVLSKAGKNRLKKYLVDIFDIRNDTMGHCELNEMMQENTIIHGSNMWILMMAILIASIGLNMNSTAVIIGAMLISPLMSGILTMGYSLATRDLQMLRRAAVRFGTQVAISLITSTIYFMITPLDVATGEMIARTTPTLWDVLIALFGGIAGMIGNTRQKKSNVIPGVAIATALMPPLCTAGYGLATLQLSFLVGAFYLFFINTMFIMLSAALVTKLLGVPIHDEVDIKRRKKINRMLTGITVITVIPSILIGAWTVYNSVEERNIENYLKKEFVFSETQIVQSRVDHVDKTIYVSLVGAQISDEAIEILEKELAQYDLKRYSLHVTQNKPTEWDQNDKVTIAVQENTISQLQQQLAEQQEKLGEMESSMSSQLDCGKIAMDAESIFTKLKNCRCGVMSNGDESYILLSATAEKSLSAEEKQTIKNWLDNESNGMNTVVEIKVKQK